MKIGTVLLLYRESIGQAQTNLAEDIGIGQTVLSKIERGQSPDITTWLKITNWLLSDSF